MRNDGLSVSLRIVPIKAILTLPQNLHGPLTRKAGEGAVIYSASNPDTYASFRYIPIAIAPPTLRPPSTSILAPLMYWLSSIAK